MFKVHILVDLVKHKSVLYIISLKMGDMDLLKVDVSHFKADHVCVYFIYSYIMNEVYNNQPRLQAIKTIILFIATHKINKHTDQHISVNALSLGHNTTQLYAIKFVHKHDQP
jgi:hypothetical protein